MATARIIPKNVAANLATLAAALDAQTNITAAAVVPSLGNVDVKRAHVFVTGAASVDITNAITAVTNCEIMPGTAIVP